MEFKLVSRPLEKLVLPGDLVNAVVAFGAVNWAEEAVLVVDLGEKRTGGHAVEVLSVSAVGDELVVQVRVVQPGPGAFVPQVMTHPYAVHRVPRTHLSGSRVTLVAHDQAGRELHRQVVDL